MIDRRTFVYVLVCSGLNTTLRGQTRVETAHEFVKQTRKYADDLGRALANQDMFDIAMKVLMRADEVATSFRQYEHLHGIIIDNLEHRTEDLLQSPQLLRGGRKELRDRYQALKVIVRQRYEASWIPTDLDKAKQDLVEAFNNGAKELNELSKSGRTPSKAELDTKTEVPDGYQVPQQQPLKFECTFFAKPGKSSTDVGSGGTSSGSEAPAPGTGTEGDYFLSCPGPEGDNDWIKWSNYFGQAAVFIWPGIIYTGPVGVIFLIATIALAALALITGAIGIFVRGDAIEAETREINEAEMYKFLHSALPSDVVESYKKQALSNVVLLQDAAGDVKTFLKGEPTAKNQLLKKHEAERKSQGKFGERLKTLMIAKCRINARKNSKPEAAGEECPIDRGPGAAQQATDDENLVKNEQKAMTIDLVWGFVRFQMIEMLITTAEGRTQEQERRAWQQLDQTIERAFLKVMTTIDLVSDIAEIEDKSITDKLTTELHNIHQYGSLRSQFFALVGDAVRVAYGDMPLPKYKQEVAAFQTSLDQFITGQGASSSVGVNLQHAFILLKQRSL